MRNFSFAALFFLFALVVVQAASFAQEASVIPLASASAPTPTTAPVAYQLPYPGILPDSPLYFLKTFRDRLVAFLISDPLKKAEFNLLQANKRLQAGVFLLDKTPKDVSLSISTISKGQNYFEEALVSVSDAKKQGMPLTTILEQLSLASQKQKEVLSRLEKKIPQSNKEEFNVLRKRAEKIEKAVDLLISKNKKK